MRLQYRRLWRAVNSGASMKRLICRSYAPRWLHRRHLISADCVSIINARENGAERYGDAARQ